MDRQARILVLDDLERWREQLLEILQRAGFLATTASTASEAIQKLNETLYHILILDIRLVDVDPTNEEGIDLLGELDKRGLSEATKIIVLSAYGTKDQMRTAFKDHKVADFLYKDEFNARVFLESIRQVLLKEVNINLSLAVHWQQISAPEQAVGNLEINGERIKRNKPFRSQIAFELDDLLCRLFFDAESVLVRPLTEGQSITGVLKAQPFYSSGGGRAVIVKFGDFHRIDEEYVNFKKFVKPFIGGGRNSTILDVRRTPHLGGIAYSLLGADNDHLEDLGNFYRHASISEVRDAMSRLFLDTCGTWYANIGRLQPYNLTEEYQRTLGFTIEKLDHALAELQRTVHGKQKLFFHSLNNDRPFTNPISGLTGPPLIRSTYHCTTHGDFNHQNLLIDSSGHTWLIDFQRTGLGHILRDVAQLDSEIRLVLLTQEEATLEERYHMEEALCSIAHFSQVDKLLTMFSTQNKAVAKAYTVVVHLRTLAWKLVAQNPADEISEYYIALLYNAMNTTRFSNLPSGQREHALLSASLLADCIASRE